MTADPSPQLHPSHLALELWAFTPESEPRDAAVGAHVERCSNCANSVNTWRAQRSAFLGQHHAQPVLDAITSAPSRLPQQGRLQPVQRLGLALALAASLLAVVGVGLKLRASDERVHLKGDLGLTLELLVSRDGALATPAPLGAMLAQGDVLRFAVSVPDDGYVFIANVDATGRLTRYFPTAERAGSERLNKATRFVLPGSIALDDYLGDERIVLIYSTTPLEAARIEQALAAAYQRAGLDGLEHAELPARLTSIPVHKAAR